MTDKLDLSFVIPLLDEEGSLEALHAQLTSVLKELGCSYEILFVNDGSTDSSPSILDRLAEHDPHVGVIHFRRCFGKAAALDAGFEMARGDFICTMDADLQDEPSEVPSFLVKIREGWDLVSGWKQKRRDPLGKTLPSKLFNFVVSRMSGLALNDFNCGFKLYRREALEGVRLYGELHRYIPVLVHWRGFRVTEIPVKHNPRTTGRSKFGVERLLHGFFDLLTVLLITRYRSRPLHLFGLVGVSMSFAGLVCLAYLSALWFMRLGPIGNRPLMTLGVLLLLVGTQFISVGLLGEMINNTRPSDVGKNYVVRTVSRPRASNEQLREIPDAEPVDAARDPQVPAQDRRPRRTGSS
jgi:glycosyltransferase involved in cell wall biosynthesis